MDSSTSSENLRLMSSTDVKRQPDRPLPTLKECSPTWIWRVGVHLSLIGVPITYLVILAIVGSLNGDQQHAYGDDILEILQIASTLWPISFAAVLGPFLKTLALFKAERGATVGSLEFLLSGQTTVSAFKNLFTLQHLRFWTIGIVGVWCLSPLGGQAIVRSMSLETARKTTELPATHYFSQVPLKYFTLDTMNLTGDTNVFGSGSVSMSAISDFRRVVISALSGRDLLVSHANRTHTGFNEAVERLGGYAQAARLSRQDMWQNVRIPYMEYLYNYDAENPTVWTLVSGTEIIPFSSFIGIPIRGGAELWVGNSSMTLQSRYQTLECTDHLNGTAWMQAEKPRLAYFHEDILNVTSGEHISSFPEGSDTGTKPSLWLDVLKSNSTDEHFFDYTVSHPSSSLQLLVGGTCPQGPTSEYTGIRICNVSTSYVDVGVECTRPDYDSDLKCEARRIRRSKPGQFSTMLSDLSEYRIASGISFEMPSITATYDLRLPSLLEKYIRNPPTAFNFEEDDDSRIYGGCYKDVPRQDFEARLATALNTFLMASYNYTVLTGADGTNLTQRNDMWQNCTATWNEYTWPAFTLNIPWYIISMVSTIILLACSVSNAILRHLIIAPDVLGSVDGLIRDSPYVKIDNESSKVSSGVSSQDRIRYTKDIYVQIQDVQPDGNMGKIALTSDVRRSRLDWKRVYTN